MLKQYLCGAIQDLNTLISYTELDIEDIKQAKHDEIFTRNTQKESLIKEFETKKKLLDEEVYALMQHNPNRNLQEIVGEEIVELFHSMRKTLVRLKQVNSDYARMVFAVSEFFTSLMDTLVPKDTTGYGEDRRISSTQPSSLLQVRA